MHVLIVSSCGEMADRVARGFESRGHGARCIDLRRPSSTRRRHPRELREEVGTDWLPNLAMIDCGGGLREAEGILRLLRRTFGRRFLALALTDGEEKDDCIWDAGFEDAIPMPGTEAPLADVPRWENLMRWRRSGDGRIRRAVERSTPHRRRGRVSEGRQAVGTETPSAAAEHAKAGVSDGAPAGSNEAIFAGLPQCVAIYARDRRFLFANDAFCAANRIGRDDLLGRTDEEVFPDSLVAQYRESLDGAFRGARSAQVQVRRRDDGAERVDSEQFVPIRAAWADVDLVVRTGIDVTAYERAIDDLRLNEKRFHAAAVGADIGVTACDRELRVIWTFQGKLTANPETMIGRRIGDVAEVEDRAALEELIRAAMSNKAAVCGEFALQEGGDGSQRRLRICASPFIEEDGRASGTILSSVDITGLRTTQRALERTQRIFALLEEQAQDLIWSFVSPKDPEYLSPSWQRLTGRSIGDFRIEDWIERIHPDDVAPFIEFRRRAWEMGVHTQFEFRMRGEDANYRWYWGRLVPKKDDQGCVQRVVGTATDITERKQAEEALRMSKEELEGMVRARTSELERKADELQRSNAELQRFAHIASHDLQEPLRIVVSYAQLLARRYQGKLDESADEYIEFMTVAARRMRQLIEDLLVYSRAESEATRLAPVASTECVREAISRNSDEIHRAGASVAVGRLPTVEGDRELLGRLFGQLIANAVKFRSAEAPRIAVSATASGKEWIFTVSDNGIGIPAEFRQTVFEPFRRLHRWEDYAGTGIGLAICRRIVENHGGRIWIEDGDAGGAAVRFTLRAAQAEARGVAPGRQPGRGGE